MRRRLDRVMSVAVLASTCTLMAFTVSCRGRDFNEEGGAETEGRKSGKGAGPSLRMTLDLNRPTSCSASEKIAWTKWVATKITEAACNADGLQDTAGKKNPCARTQASCPSSAIFKKAAGTVKVDTSGGFDRGMESSSEDESTTTTSTSSWKADVTLGFAFPSSSRTVACVNPISHPNKEVFETLATEAWDEGCKGRSSGSPVSNGPRPSTPSSGGTSVSVPFPQCPAQKNATTKRTWAVLFLRSALENACNSMNRSRSSPCARTSGTTCESGVEFTYQGAKVSGELSGSFSGTGSQTTTGPDSPPKTSGSSSSSFKGSLTVELQVGPGRETRCVNPAELPDFTTKLDGVISDFERVCGK